MRFCPKCYRMVIITPTKRCDLCGSETSAVGGSDVIWTMKDKGMIPIKFMKDDHLINTIKMLLRLADRHRCVSAMQCDMHAGITGDMASFQLEQEAERLYRTSNLDYAGDEMREEGFSGVFNALYDEFQRRNLEEDFSQVFDHTLIQDIIGAKEK